MCASWAPGFDPTLIVEKLNKGRNIANNGKVEYKFPNFPDNFDIDSVLLSIVQLHPTILDADRRSIVVPAKFSGTKPQLTAGDLLKAISANERKFLRQPAESYVFLTSVSIPPHKTSVRYDGSTISIGNSMPSAFRKAQEPHMDLLRRWLHAELPRSYTSVRISTSGRSPHEAMQTALDRLDELRCIWNFGLSGTGSWRQSSGRRHPVNKIVVGPLHSLHKPNGQAAVDYGWYEPEYTGEIPTVHLNAEKLSRLRRWERTFRGHLRGSNYRDWLRVAMRRYVRALDPTDWHTSFLKLWSVLELLTDTGKRGYDETIRRASFATQEHAYHRMVLEHLRLQRNQATHVGSESRDRETHLYQLKRYVDTLIELHLIKGSIFSNPQEAARFLDLPPGLNEIKRRRELLQLAYTYRSGK